MEDTGVRKRTDRHSLAHAHRGRARASESARMATLVESADMETLGGQTHAAASPTSTGPSQRFNDGKFYLLVVIGEITSEEQLKCAIADIERGGTEGRGGGMGGMRRPPPPV